MNDSEKSSGKYAQQGLSAGHPKPALSILLPCLDEAEGLPRVEAELFASLDGLGTPYEVLAVDDGSRDATLARLEELAARRPELRVLRHERTRGLGAALKTGIAAAAGDWLVPLDADLTFHPRSIADLLAAQRGSDADCVCGSPWLGTGSEVPPGRRLPSLLLNAFYRGAFDRRFSAYTPMFRLYRLSALRPLRIASDGFEVSAEILVRLLRAGGRIVEVPAPLSVRRTGVSKLRRSRELWAHLRLIARLLARA
ncbi:MAG: glycosyltransferase family 2 protein [Elusimicrobiota bacterium]|jgi:dolichol-phosphate mannosyltransferase